MMPENHWMEAPSSPGVMDESCLIVSSPEPSPSSSRSGSPLIGSSGRCRQEKQPPDDRRHRVRDDYDATLACAGEALLRGGPVRQPFSADTADCLPCLPLHEPIELESLLLSMAQASYALELECAAVATSSHSERRQFYSVRQRAVRKMRALNDYLDRRGALVEPRWRQEAEAGLHRLHRRIGHLAPPEPADQLCRDPTLASRRHQLFHLQLELRLRSVSALARLASLGDRPPGGDAATGPPVPWLATSAAGRHRWRRPAHVLAWELAMLAHNKMKETRLSDLADTPAFSCGCEKGAWLALRRLLEPEDSGSAPTDGDGPAGLWTELEPMFGYILSGPPPPPPADSLVEEFLLPEVPRWTEAPLFLIWLMASVGDVFRYDAGDTYRTDVECGRSTSQLLSLVSAASEAAETAGPAGTEERFSCLLALCGRLTQLWGPTPALTNRLWEVAARRLLKPQTNNGPVSVLQMTSLVPRSGRRWFESVSDPGPAPAADSFSQYLLQLPAQLADAAGADCWRQLRGRVLLRLHPRRAAQLGAAGLREACNLLLTLLHTVREDRQLVDKFVAFLSLVSESSTHDVLVCRAYFAAMHILLESGRDVGAVAAAAAAQADRELRAAAAGRPGSPQLLAAYWEECADLVRASPRLDKSEFQLVTAGWRAYLGCCGSAEQARGLSVLQRIAGKLLSNLQQLQPVAHVVDSEVVTRKEQYAQLTERLRLLSPLLHSLALSAGAPQELAPLAATLTLIPGAGCQPQHFTTDTVTARVCAAYVTELLSSAPERLTSASSSPDRLARLWLRCWAGGADLSELGPMTAAVARCEPLVPAGQPGDPRTAAQFADRLERLASQSKEGRGRVNALLAELGFVDAYLRGPRGSSAPGLAHLYLVFATLVRRLIHVLEMRTVVSIYQRLVLPPAVYSADKPLPPPLRNALARSIPLFLAGIAATDYTTEKSYRRFVKDTLINYICRFTDGTHPLLDVFRSDDISTEFKVFLMQIMAETFLQKIGGKFHANLLQAAQLLSALVSAGTDQQAALVARWAAGPLLELLLTLEEPRTKRAATDLLKLLCRATDQDVSSALLSALERLLERHLAFSSGRVFTLLEVVAVLAPRLTAQLLPSLQRHVRRTEVRRGAGEDRTLRNGMARVERRLASVGVAVPTSQTGAS